MMADMPADQLLIPTMIWITEQKITVVSHINSVTRQLLGNLI